MKNNLVAVVLTGHVSQDRKSEKVLHMDEETLCWAEKQARYYQTLTCSRRVLILWALAERELSVGEIATEVGATMQNTSQHLNLMKKRGILDSRRDGQTIYYSVVDRKLLVEMGIPDQKSITEKL